MQSIVAALRSLVMLVSLLAVPLAAIYGTGTWPRVQAQLDQARLKLAAALDPTRAPSTVAPESPMLTDVATLAGPPIAPLSVAPTPAGTDHVEPSPPPATLPVSLPPEMASPPVAMSPAAPEPPKATPSVVDAHVLPAGFNTAGLPRQGDPFNAAPAPTAPESSNVPPPDSPDRMGWIQHRLQTLGADSYRLDTIGPAGDTFRFQCKMVSVVNPNYVRYFEATSNEPLRAMQHVLDQVDAWVVRR